MAYANLREQIEEEFDAPSGWELLALRVSLLEEHERTRKAAYHARQDVRRRLNDLRNVRRQSAESKAARRAYEQQPEVSSRRNVLALARLKARRLREALELLALGRPLSRGQKIILRRAGETVPVTNEKQEKKRLREAKKRKLLAPSS